MTSESIDNLITGLENVSNDESAPQWARVIANSNKEILKSVMEFSTLRDKILELESHIQLSQDTNERLTVINEGLRSDIADLELKLDDYEQRNRNNCLLLHGIPESSKEITDEKVVNIINNQLDVPLTLDDIHRSHRVGPRSNQRVLRSSNQRPRPIIFRLISFRKRQEIFKSKKKLKGQPFSITESLTKLRYDLYRKSIERLGKGNCWTVEGRITTKVGTVYHTINSLDDLERFSPPEPRAPFVPSVPSAS